MGYYPFFLHEPQDGFFFVSFNTVDIKIAHSLGLLCSCPIFYNKRGQILVKILLEIAYLPSKVTAGR